MPVLYNGELPAAPRAQQGGAIRVETVLPAGKEQSASALSGSVVGPVVELDAVPMVPVTFATNADPTAAILVHLSGYTDRHRQTLAPSLLRPIPETTIHAATFLLPADGVISYRIADVTGLPDDIGTSRAGWREVHRRGRPDPAQPIRIPTPLGGDASVWWGPQLGSHRWPATESLAWIEVADGDRRIRVLPGDERVVVLLDGQFWEPLATGTGLRAAGCTHTLVAIPTSMADREHEMTTAPAAGRLVRRALLAASKAVGREIGKAFAVVGQSYGGLAVAQACAFHPELLEHGIIQSGSFWYPDPAATQPGELTRQLAAQLGDVSTPIHLQVGSEEDDMVYQARWYRDALTARGAEVNYAEARGGHDYAWWRIGLAETLCQL